MSKYHDRAGVFLSDYLKLAGKLSDFPQERLPGMHLYDHEGGYKGKILRIENSTAFMVGGDRIKIKNKSRYFVTGRPPEKPRLP